MLSTQAVILLLCFSLTVASELQKGAVRASAPRNCYSCKGINCQRTTRQNATVKCTDLLDICVTVYEGFRVSERGCLLELSVAAQSKCHARDPRCQKCGGDLCNNQGRVDFQCIQCSGSDDSKCNSAGDSISAAKCSAPTGNNAYCYVRAVGSNLQRGCALSVKEQMNCLQDNDCSLCLPENGHGSSACNNYALEFSASGAKGQQVFGLLLGLISVLTIQGLN
ncbi:uncharacterized protein LOC111601247 [Drosophila hydei]|uniref:Uncharacterized protein LOC111601247 n=1 Tax=Drosophila hydei TaxID=7224 RepID=A0A6J1M5E3_DROHY|nr:uncharacterized protein LOC111601247 [Drosophila hydei]